MRVVILDTVTGIKTEVKQHFDHTYWTDGNGSCDCNRRLLCGVQPEATSHACEGCCRFLIVEVVELEDNDPICTLDELNRDYMHDLKKAHGVI